MANTLITVCNIPLISYGNDETELFSPTIWWTRLFDIKQPQYHNYIRRDTVGHSKIRTAKYVMNDNENKRKDECLGTKSAISGAHSGDPAIFRCLWNLWKTKFSK